MSLYITIFLDKFPNDLLISHIHHIQSISLSLPLLYILVLLLLHCYFTIVSISIIIYKYTYVEYNVVFSYRKFICFGI